MNMVQRWLLAAIVVGLPASVLAQEVIEPEIIAVPAISRTPFAVSESARQGLPPVDCWHCFGPWACPPCDCHHEGFLYYATCPWDDDPKNYFDDCLDGECGHMAVGLSRAWIGWQERRPRWLRKDACCE